MKKEVSMADLNDRISQSFSDSDSELVSLAASGDHIAFAQLAKKYEKTIKFSPSFYGI